MFEKGQFQIQNFTFYLFQDLLIQVKAASVNPLDVLMSQGYGFSLFELMRSKSIENFSTFIPFPTTLGRDFSGVVVDKGMDVNDLNVGDQVIFDTTSVRPTKSLNLTSNLYLLSHSIGSL